MPSISICQCGYTETYHPFRHPFNPVVQIERKDNTFILDAEQFPQLESTPLCEFPQCGKSKQRHHDSSVPLEERTGIKHDFKPGPTYMYRKIQFRLPEYTTCLYKFNKYDKQEERVCGLDIMSHVNEHTHSFHTNIIINNKSEKDVVEIIHPDDEDLKIINISE